MARVEIYTAMLCGFCHAARTLLKRKGVGFEEIDVTADPDRRAEMVARAGGRTSVPQIFIDNVHIGGCDDIQALEAAGELDAKLDMPSTR